MKGKIFAVLALSAALAVPAAFAQQSGTQSEPAQPAAVSAQSGQVEVTGTIASLTADKVEIKVDSVTAPQGNAAGSTVMVGSTPAFAIDSTTDMPQGLKVGDRVNLWFASDNGALRATRLALAPSSDNSAGTNESASGSQPSGATTSGSTDQSSTSAPSPSDQSSTSASTSSQQPSTSGSSASAEQQPASTAAAPANEHRGNLPKTGSPLPLIGLLGLAALASVLVLRFVLRV